jgi:hypothetical protein
MESTAAQDAIVRLALVMLTANVRATISPDVRRWCLDRLQDTTTPLSAEERAAIREPVLAHIAAHHPRILAIVTQQFTDDAGAGDRPQGDTPHRPSHHYGTVPENHRA